jgi:hypothetical protein
VSASDSPSWMPVFVVRRGQRSHHAVHPDEPAQVQKTHGAQVDDYFVRIGSATRQTDGSFVIRLWALPVDGTLFMRAPQPGEQLDPTLTGGK